MKFLSSVTRRLGVADHVYIVGGAVRNFVIKEPIKDIDVVVDSVSLGRGRDSAWLAREIAKVIPVPTNLITNSYGVAILTVKGDWILEGHNLNGEVIEIANARKESYGGSEGKGYKPTDVQPATIFEDMARREFTFNTLMWRLYDLADGPDKAEILDLIGCGLRDLQEGVMRCPSDPDKTFSDDPSRMIRAIKFLIKYRFKISPEVEASIRRNARKLKNIPPGHLSNMIIGLFYETGVGKAAFLEMNKLGLLNVVREIIAENKPFRDALGNWAEKHAEIGFLFDLMDLHMPVGSALSFLTPAQKSQLREQLVRFSNGDEARDFVSCLQQPGKIVNMGRLIQVLGLKGLDIRRLTDLIRQLLLDDPALAGVPDYLEDLIIKRMGGPRTASVGNVRQMIDTFKQEAIDDGYEIHELGKVRGLPIILLKPRVMDPDLPNLMVIAGTHGNEPSGPNVCLEILQDPPKGANLSFIPLVNPVGREKMTREDVAGKDPNRGWRDGKNKGVPTPEGKIIKRNRKLLKELAKDGVLSFHEDGEADGFYIYDSENVNEPGPLARRLRSVGRRFFPVASPGVDDFGDEREDGFILNPDDDAFEDWMHFDVGVTPVLLVELPSKRPWDLRIKSGEALVRAFADFHQQNIRAQKIAARYISRCADRDAELNLSPGQWQDIRRMQMDTSERERLWHLYHVSYGNIGEGIADLSALLSEFELFWVVDVDGDRILDAFIAYKRTPAGNKIAIMGSDGTVAAKRAVVARAMKLLKTRGWYAELSHRPAQLAESSGVPKVMDENVVREALRKDIEWLGDGHYRRVITGLGNVVKAMYGRPIVHRVRGR